MDETMGSFRIKATLIVVAALTAACSSGTTSSPPSAATTAPTAAGTMTASAAATAPAASSTAPLFGLLPANIAASGVIQGATLDNCQPWSYFGEDKTTLLGVDAELTTAMEQLLGIKVSWLDMEFPSQIPSLEAGRVDLIFDCIGDTSAREKVLDFIDYSHEAEAAVVAKGNPLHIQTLQDLCGKRVTLITGSMSVQWATTFQPTCGSNPMKLTQLADDASDYLSVSSGRADATLETYGSSVYLTKNATSGSIYTQLEVSPIPPFDPAVQGIAFNKTNSQLRDAFKAALQKLMDNGTYQQIMDKWGVGSLTVPAAVINQALH